MPMYQRSLFVLALLAAFVIGGTFYGYSTSDDVVALDAAEKPEHPAGNDMTVYVTGAVNRPGIVTVAAESRVVDAVNACGGLLPTADAENINMAQSLKDGQQVRVPEKEAAASTGITPDKSVPAGAKAANTANGKVNINTADEAALDTLPGVGPAMAKRIIEYRMTEGMFQSIEDIKKVRGIGEAKFEKMKDKISI